MTRHSHTFRYMYDPVFFTGLLRNCESTFLTSDPDDAVVFSSQSRPISL